MVGLAVLEAGHPVARAAMLGVAGPAAAGSLLFGLVLVDSDLAGSAGPDDRGSRRRRAARRPGVYGAVSNPAVRVLRRRPRRPRPGRCAGRQGQTDPRGCARGVSAARRAGMLEQGADRCPAHDCAAASARAGSARLAGPRRRRGWCPRTARRPVGLRLCHGGDLARQPLVAAPPRRPAAPRRRHHRPRRRRPAGLPHPALATRPRGGVMGQMRTLKRTSCLSRSAPIIGTTQQTGPTGVRHLLSASRWPAGADEAKPAQHASRLPALLSAVLLVSLFTCSVSGRRVLVAVVNGGGPGRGGGAPAGGGRGPPPGEGGSVCSGPRGGCADRAGAPRRSASGAWW